MWTRKEIKNKAKQNLSKSYWSIFVLILLFSAITGTVSNFMFKETVINLNRDIRYVVKDIYDNVFNHNLSYDHNNFENNKINSNYNVEVPNLDDMNKPIDDIDHPPFDDMKRPSFDIEYDLNVIFDTCSDYVTTAIYTTSFLAIILIFPLTVGMMRFLINSTKDKHRLEDLVSIFDRNYKYLVVSGMLTKLYIFFWSLLFIIPGIIKTYEYRMIPYILAENPDIGFTKAKDLSRKMTYGNKWKMFLLDLSFIGWYILGLLCCFIGVIFVKPYVVATKAELYLKLKENIELNEESVKLED